MNPQSLVDVVVMTTNFEPSAFFKEFGMHAISSQTFDELIQNTADDLVCIFLWGQDCYNCNVFKQTAMGMKEKIQDLNLRWFQADVYQDEALGLKFGLHGVPCFVFFYCGRRLGRISGWQGLPYFTQVVEDLRKKIQQPSWK